ncbi:MAG: hypothetical protein U0572_17375 [Phycisphaerales bacterium]
MISLATRSTAPLAPLRHTAPRPLHDRAAEHERLERKKIHHASRQLVADALVTPVLAQFRESQQHGGVFGVTTAEERLGPIIDQRVADSIVSRGHLPIVDRVETSMLRRAGLRPQHAPGRPVSTHGPTYRAAYGKARIA